MLIYNPKCLSQFRKWLCPSRSLRSVAMYCYIYDFELLPNTYLFLEKICNGYTSLVCSRLYINNF